MKKKYLFVMLCLLSAFVCQGQTALSTSFETTGSPAYSVGNLNGQNGWTLSTTGVSTATVYTAKAQEGTQSVNLVTTNSAPLLNYVKYSGTVPGIPTLSGGSDVYADFWVNPTSIGTSSFAINGYDLYGGSSKRIFIIEFTTDNKIWAYNGSSRSSTVVGNWVANAWVRVSVKADFSAEKYKVAVNGTVYGTDLAFRETYTPTASGTRASTTKELHSIRFSNLTETSLSTSDIAIDNVYVGTDPISDVSFGGSSTTRTITVTQPAYGSIALNPAVGPYTLNQSVTATLTLPAGYINNGWTGNLSGTTSPQTFTVLNNMTISANVDIDPSNPPPKYTITLVQPANGTITLSSPPESDGKYYKEKVLTATVSFDACYSFSGWTGGTLSGTQTSSSFTVQGDATIGATIVSNTSAPVIRTVTSVTNFKSALTAMNPGDILEVADGSYNLGSLTITRSGCEDKPILIVAKNKGGATLNGGTSLKFSKLNYVTLSGFKIESVSVSTGIKIEDCSHVRITNNSFKLTETSSCTWIYIGDTYASPEPLKSGYNRIDHNIFDGKTQTGNYIKMDGNIDSQTKYDTINYNWFKNNQPRATNEKECIRVGVSTLSQSSGFTLIEYNLFEDCDGDPEIVSIKSCDNTVRYNTFVRCLGTLSLRHGNRSLVEGNYFFGEGKTVGSDGCGGIRVYGKDHKIINNYFQGLTGYKWDAAITITNGDVFNNSTSLSSHYVPENLIIAHNTLVNNVSNIEIGFDNGSGSTTYGKAPINCVLSNNLVVENTTPIVKSYSNTSLAGVSFVNNMMYPTGSATVGITYNSSQIMIANPFLVQPTCNLPASNCMLTNAYKVFRINSNSLAKDAATGVYAYADKDQEQQARTGAKDIGADEYNGNATVYTGALDAIHVGPDAIPFVYGYTFNTTIPIRAISLSAQYDQSQVRLLWDVIGEESVKEYAVEWSKNGKDFSQIAVVNAKSVAANNSYEAWHKTPTSGINYYRIKVINYGTPSTYSRVQAINTENDTKLHMYPIPANDFITISGKISEGATINIISSLGVGVKQVSLSAGITGNRISINDLPSGNYRMQIIENGQALQYASFMIVR